MNVSIWRSPYGRIAFPYILFISLAALVSGVLNATGRFTAAAAAPVLLNVIFIAAMLWLVPRMGWDGAGAGLGGAGGRDRATGAGLVGARRAGVSPCCPACRAGPRI